MQAVRIDEHGDPDVLRVVEVPVPTPGPGQILIRVEAAAVNWSDTMRRRGDAYPFPTALPFIPGGEVAGTVEALGDGVEGPPVGTPVFALVGADGSGGYAQFAVAGAPMVVPRPAAISADAAASIMIAGGTAMLLVREAARLTSGETVVVVGAGGGVGQYIVRIARALGAGTIVGTAGSEVRSEAALAAGADHVVDHSSRGWSAEVRELTGGADVVLETGGESTIHDSFASLGPFGRLVVYGYASGSPGALSPAEQMQLYYDPVLNQSVVGFNVGLWFGVRPQAAVAALTELVGLVAAGVVAVPVAARLPLAEAARGHRLLEERSVAGKIVLSPWD